MANTFHADNPLNRFLYKFGTMILINIYFSALLPSGNHDRRIIQLQRIRYAIRCMKNWMSKLHQLFKTFGKNFIDSSLCG